MSTAGSNFTLLVKICSDLLLCIEEVVDLFKIEASLAFSFQIDDCATLLGQFDSMEINSLSIVKSDDADRLSISTGKDNRGSSISNPKTAPSGIRVLDSNRINFFHN